MKRTTLSVVLWTKWDAKTRFRVLYTSILCLPKMHGLSCLLAHRLLITRMKSPSCSICFGATSRRGLSNWASVRRGRFPRSILRTFSRMNRRIKTKIIVVRSWTILSIFPNLRPCASRGTHSGLLMSQTTTDAVESRKANADGSATKISKHRS